LIISGTYPATVTAIDDPEQRGRIRVACSALMGDEETEMPHWVDPVYEWGWFIVPDPGEIVDVEVAEGAEDDEHRGQISIQNLNPRWKGRYWGGNDTENARKVPDDFKTNYGKRRGFATPGGHVMMFDDTEGKKKFSITKAGANGEFTYLAADEDGSWIMANKNGSLLYMNAKTKEMSWIDEHGNTISSTSTGIKLIDKSGGIVEMKDGAIQVLSPGAVTISCKNAVIDAGKVELAQPAVDAVIKGTTFMPYFLAHIHPTGLGPSGPPVATGAEATLLSTKVVVG
jgi:type VI secretion system (T6SS) baseplate-like injector VgrG